jgi:anti-sigma regulatory factor (Ser/Thr protein kinase)
VGFNREAVCDMEVAVSEAVTNSVQHGSPDPLVAGILVKCEASSERVVFEVQDESPLETLPKTNPNKHDLNNERGRGVNIMRSLMDECEDTRTESGIKVRMAKKNEESG